MNYLSLISFFIFSSSFNPKTYNNDPTNYYIIEKIDSISKYYLIYVRRNGALYKMLSEKEEPIGKGCYLLKVNNYYPFDLESAFSPEANYQILDIGGLIINGIKITIDEPGIVHNLYYDDRIHGLYFCK